MTRDTASPGQAGAAPWYRGGGDIVPLRSATNDRCVETEVSGRSVGVHRASGNAAFDRRTGRVAASARGFESRISAWASQPNMRASTWTTDWIHPPRQ